MNANERPTANHDESCEQESRNTSQRSESHAQTARQGFSWYSGQVDERVLRVILHLDRTTKK
jgi:hypothetical protein